MIGASRGLFLARRAAPISRTMAASMNSPLSMNPVVARSMSNHTIVYTDTDEAPYLATYSLLPIFQKFTKPFGIDMVTPNIPPFRSIMSLVV